MGEQPWRSKRKRWRRWHVIRTRLTAHRLHHDAGLDRWAPEPTGRARNRAMGLVGGRRSAAGLRELANRSGRGLQPLLDRVASGEEFMARTAEVLLAGVDREARSVP